MTNECTILTQLLEKIYQQDVTNIAEDIEAKDYDGYNFDIGALKFKFRKSKITPKKVGQFVTLWKRNTHNQTQPYDEHDQIDYYVIATTDQEKSGFFIFPKTLLIEKNILASSSGDGKRGFRLYPYWAITTNNQATKTKSWQTAYFIANDTNEEELINRLQAYLT